MIRFLMQRYDKLICGGERTTHYTIDGDLVALEVALKSGGCNEYECEIHTLIGAEVVETTQQGGGDGSR